MRKQTLETIVRNVSEKLPFGAESTRFQTAVILLASAQVGPNIKRIAQFTGYPRQEVARRARHLRDNGVWNGPRVLANWSDPQSGYAELRKDVQAAERKLSLDLEVRRVLFE